jgi:hypothetical protein
MVLMLGYPGMGKRTVGSRLADELDGVLVDSQLLFFPVVSLWRWDGKSWMPPEIWDRVALIRDVVLQTIEDLAPSTNSYVFTNVLKDEPDGAASLEQLRSLAQRRGSLFLPVMLTCDIDVQVSRIDNADRIALRKGSDPDGYRWHRENTVLFQPLQDETFTIDTTTTPPEQNAEKIYLELIKRGFRPNHASRGNAISGQDRIS